MQDKFILAHTNTTIYHTSYINVSFLTGTDKQQWNNNAYIYSPWKLGGLGVTSSYDNYQVRMLLMHSDYWRV